MSMWGAAEYREAARQAVDSRTRRDLLDEADRIQARDATLAASSRVQITITVGEGRNNG